MLTTNRNFPGLYDRDEFLTPFDKIFDRIVEQSLPNLSKEFGIDFFEKGAYPKVDILDYPTKVTIFAEIPGLSKRDLSITFENPNLTLSGEKRIEPSSEIYQNTKYIHRELKRSRFKRTFVIHESLDGSKIKAKFEDGILIIDIPKMEVVPQVTTKIKID